VLNAEPSTSLSWQPFLHFTVALRGWYHVTGVSTWQTYACVQTCRESPWFLSRGLAAAIQHLAISQCELSLLMSAGKKKKKHWVELGHKLLKFLRPSSVFACNNFYFFLLSSLELVFFYLYCFSRTDLCYPSNTQILLLRFGVFFRGWWWCLFAFEFSGMHRSCNGFSMAAFIFIDSYQVYKQCLQRSH